MTEILTWNIQTGRGVDGRVDLGRIVSIIKAMGDPDVICLQEICRFMPGLGGIGSDQVEILAAGFPGMAVTFGAAIDWPNKNGETRAAFGNMVLSRLAITQTFSHPLPQPPAPDVMHMPRQATEAVVETSTGPLRIVTTHLEYHAENQRLAQVARLRDLHQEIAANDCAGNAFPETGPYAAPARPASAVLCGDFNMVADDPVYRDMAAPFADDTPPLIDAWRHHRPEAPHDPTCGIFDREQWQQGPHCRDYFFVTPDVADRIEEMTVDQETDASDHQPVLLRLRD